MIQLKNKKSKEKANKKNSTTDTNSTNLVNTEESMQGTNSEVQENSNDVDNSNTTYDKDDAVDSYNSDIKLDDQDMIRCENLVKIYKTSEIEVMALQGLDLTVKRGELMAIIGNSGSGKSTFLNMVGGLDRPSAGRLYVDGKDLFNLNEKDLVEYKQKSVGFVWQNNARNLFPYLTAIENVTMPMLFSNTKEANEKAEKLLELVGMESKKHNKLSQLSGGEQQRIAIAIALANEPKLLLADEPTGAVDAKTSAYILDVFRKLNEELGITIVIVTHDNNLAKKVNRVVMIRDGKTSSERLIKNDYAKKLDEIGELADESAVHEEFAVLDRAGRVQIHREYLDKMGITDNKIKMEFIDGKIILTKPDL